MLDVGRSIGWKTSWGEGESELITDDLHQAAGGILGHIRWFLSSVADDKTLVREKAVRDGSTQVNERSALGHILHTIGGEEPD